MTCYVISGTKNGAGHWNVSETTPWLMGDIVNPISPDDQVTQGARLSIAMQLKQLSQNVPEYARRWVV